MCKLSCMHACILNGNLGLQSTCIRLNINFLKYLSIVIRLNMFLEIVSRTFLFVYSTDRRIYRFCIIMVKQNKENTQYHEYVRGIRDDLCADHSSNESSLCFQAIYFVKHLTSSIYFLLGVLNLRCITIFICI